MSSTYIAIYVKYMYKQHHTSTYLWYECEYFNMCIHINDSYYVYYKDFHAHRAMPQIKSFMQCSNTYMYITHVIIQIESILKYWKGFFDKLVDIEINIIFKI